jgi:hypothetical protein
VPGPAFANRSLRSQLRRAGPWSLDAHVLVRPAREFQSLASVHAAQSRSSFWVAARRPLFLTFVLACGVSLIATSVASLRLIATSGFYWCFVPVVEILALALVIWRRPESRPFAHLVDLFFTGHAAWTMYLLIVAALLAMLPPIYWRAVILGPGLIGITLVVVWSAYVDVCFFRHVCGVTLGRAIVNAALHRFVTWTLVLWIFAVPTPTPFGVYHGLARDIAEVMR